MLCTFDKNTILRYFIKNQIESRESRTFMLSLNWPKLQLTLSLMKATYMAQL
jgi:hypothetical protein